MSKDPREAALLRRVARVEETSQDHEELATALGELVDYYWEVGRHQSAEAPMLRRLELFQQTHGSRHTTVARCLHDLAFLYDRLHQDAAVKGFAKRAVALWGEIDGYANGHATRLLELLARVYARQERHEELTAILDAVIPEIEHVYPRGYYDNSLAKVAELLSSHDHIPALRRLASRIRALLD